MRSLTNSRMIPFDYQNHQQDHAKNTLIELEEAEDMLNVQSIYRRKPLLPLHPFQTQGTTEKWTNTRNTFEYNMVSTPNLFRTTRNSKQKKSKKQQKQNKQKKIKLNYQSITKLKNLLNQSIITQKETDKESFKDRSISKIIQASMISTDEIIKPKKKRLFVLKLRKTLITPNIQTTRQGFPVYHRKSIWQKTKQIFAKQKSMSGALSIIKKQTQTPKQSKDPIIGKALSVKEITKLKTNWQDIKKLKNFKCKQKFNQQYLKLGQKSCI